MADPSFSLLFQLPNDAVKNVVECMDPPDIIGFSLISNKSALIVKSLNCKAEPFRVEVTSKVDVIVSFKMDGYYRFRFYESERLYFGEVSTQPPKDLYPPGYMKLFWSMDEIGTFEKKNFTMRDWMDHICKIFNQPKINSLEYKPKVFSAQSVKETFPKLYQLSIECSNEEYERMMKIFNYSESIRVVRRNINHNNELGIIPKIFIQHFERAETMANLKISLDNLLICNTQLLTIGELYMTNRGFNTFLKCWMKGACPNLKHVDIRVYTEKALDLDIVWKGIKRQNAPDNRRNTCGTCEHRDFLAFDGGVDIKRYDGTVATIFMQFHQPLRFFGDCDLKMLVQH
ncbi:hypothetical protein CAEBREN_08634 [Caenorhabditis brenneri]|uniref:F-box domain-containing protein n=1 Tax=Caenorhabditis brenneri TaxID=135651 RepID=G0MC54_CAEBE|nr:hypothetical protein CAEBREN_08634 [Caenorhabditis brenneri]